MSEIRDAILQALDAQSMMMFTAVVTAADRAFLQASGGDPETVRAAVVDYHNVAEALAGIVNHDLVGPVTAATMADRVAVFHVLMNDEFSDLAGDLTADSPDALSELRAFVEREVPRIAAVRAHDSDTLHDRLARMVRVEDSLLADHRVASQPSPATR